MKNDRRSNGCLRRIALQRAASDATKFAGEALDALLAGVAAGTPPTPAEFLQAEARWADARARERQTAQLAVRSRATPPSPPRALPPSSVRRPASSRSEEPTTQRSTRVLPRREPNGARESAPPPR